LAIDWAHRYGVESLRVRDSATPSPVLLVEGVGEGGGEGGGVGPRSSSRGSQPR
jgi:hypothetical protein